MVFSELSKYKIKPTPFLTVFEADLETLLHSKVVLAWIVLVFFVGSLIAIGNATSDALTGVGWNFFIFTYLWSLIIIGLSAGAISVEAGVVADSILSKPVKRYEYILAKLASRTIFVITVYMLGMVILTILSLRVSPIGEMTFFGWVTGLFATMIILAGLTVMGVMFSTLMPSTVVAVILDLLVWYSMLMFMPLVRITKQSPYYIQFKMPEILHGYWDSNLSYIVGIFAGLILLFSLIAVLYFEEKDLGGSD